MSQRLCNVSRKSIPLSTVDTVARPPDDLDSDIMQVISGNSNILRLSKKSVCFDHQGARFFTGSNTGELVCWDTKRLTVIHKFFGHAKQITAVHCSHSGTLVSLWLLVILLVS